MQRYTVILFACAAAACGVSQREADSTTVATFRDSLIRMGVEDQAGRDSVALAAASNDTVFMKRMMRSDSARTRSLRAYVDKRGWPRRSVVGDTAANAAWLIVQHSPEIEFQQRMLPILEEEAKRGEVKAADVAMLSDRVRIRRGEPQRYGSGFSVKDGKLVPDSIADLTALDSLRASVGMPPMSEYVKVLETVYRMPVVWPPPSQKSIRR